MAREFKTVKARGLQIDDVVRDETGEEFEVIAIDWREGLSWMGIFMHGHEGEFTYHVDSDVEILSRAGFRG